jgi:nitroreductase
MNNSLVNIIMSRRSVRSYKPEQVEEELLSAVIEAGRAAPSGGNKQLTHLIVIQNTEILRELIRVSKREFAKMPITEDMYDGLISIIERAHMPDFNFDYMYGAPTLIVAAHKKGHANALVDGACVLQNMMIAATALGLGSCYMNPVHWLDDCEGFREYMYTLGLDQNETIVGGMTLGYPAENPGPPLPRKGNPVSYVR